MITRAEDYKFVTFDGVPPMRTDDFNGGIMPLRSDKSVIRAEDIAFLAEYASERMNEHALWGFTDQLPTQYVDRPSLTGAILSTQAVSAVLGNLATLRQTFPWESDGVSSGLFNAWASRIWNDTYSGITNKSTPLAIFKNAIYGTWSDRMQMHANPSDFAPGARLLAQNLYANSPVYGMFWDAVGMNTKIVADYSGCSLYDGVWRSGSFVVDRELYDIETLGGATPPDPSDYSVSIGRMSYWWFRKDPESDPQMMRYSSVPANPVLLYSMDGVITLEWWVLAQMVVEETKWPYDGDQTTTTRTFFSFVRIPMTKTSQAGGVSRYEVNQSAFKGVMNTALSAFGITPRRGPSEYFSESQEISYNVLVNAYRVGHTDRTKWI